MPTDKTKIVRQKYGKFLDTTVQRALDASDESVEATISELEEIAENYTPQDIQPVDEYEIEDYFYKQFKEYNSIEDLSERVPLLYAIEDTIVYIFQSRLDYDKE